MENRRLCKYGKQIKSGQKQQQDLQDRQRTDNTQQINHNKDMPQRHKTDWYRIFSTHETQSKKQNREYVDAGSASWITQCGCGKLGGSQFDRKGFLKVYCLYKTCQVIQSKNVWSVDGTQLGLWKVVKELGGTNSEKGNFAEDLANCG